jgi:hypothetical protein
MKCLDDYEKNKMLNDAYVYDSMKAWWAWAWNKIIDVERKIKVERYLSKASVRPPGIKPQGIRNRYNEHV